MSFLRPSWKSIATEGWYAESWTEKATDGIFKYPLGIFIQHIKQSVLFTVKIHRVIATVVFSHVRKSFLYYSKTHLVRTTTLIASLFNKLIIKIKAKAKVGKHV